MNIILNKKFKSLLTDINITLPNFTVLSGINGAGKSHLLDAITQNIAKVTDEYGNEVNPKRYVNSNSLTPNESYQVGRENLTNEINSAWYVIENYRQQKLTNPNLTLEQHLQNNLFQRNVLQRVLDLSEKKICLNPRFPKFSKYKIQKIVDVIVSDISQNVEIEDNSKIQVFYYGSISFDIPTWYIHYRGHDLEEVIKKHVSCIKKIS